MDLAYVLIFSILVFWVLMIYPWVALSLLLLVPIFKPAAVTYIPIFRAIDLTVSVNIFVGMIGVWTYIRNKSKIKKIYVPWQFLICLILICFVFAVGMSWTTAPNYGFEKTMRMAGIGIPFLLIPALFLSSINDSIKVMYSLIFVSAFVATLLLFGPDVSLHQERYGSFYGRKTFLGSDPNTPALIVLVGILTLLLAIVSDVAPKWMKMSGFVLLPLSVAAILASGSRGNLIGLFLTLMFVPFLMRGKFASNILYVSVIVLGITGILVLAIPYLDIDIPIARWLGLAEQVKGGDLTSTRTPAWIFCITEAWDSNIALGHGPGSYAVDFLGSDQQFYPHNVWLEALYEAGLVGVIAITFFYYYCFYFARKGMRLARTMEEKFLIATSAAIVLAMTVTSFTHWNLDSARYLYLFAGVLFVIYSTIRKNHIFYRRKISVD